MAFLPEKHHSSELSPEKLLTEINSETRFFSCDEVAHQLILGDPSLQLIDVRDTASFNKFSLPGAINIPLDSLLVPAWDAYMDQPGVKTIFYSNGTVYANQAWIIYRRKDYKNLYVMNGGLNKWVETILKPVEPLATQSEDDFILYETRKAASQFFGGGQQDVTSNVQKKKSGPVKRRKKGAIEGGCS